MTAPLDLASIRRAPKALLHDHLDGGLRPATVLELAQTVRLPGSARRHGRRPRALVPRRRRQWIPRALPRDVRAHGRGDADPAGRWRGWRASARRTSPPTASCTRRSASPPSSTSRRDSISTRSSNTRSRGSREGMSAAAVRGTPIRVGCLLTAMRHAARSREIAELAIRWRDKGVVGFDIAGAEAGYPPSRHLDAFEYMRANNAHFTIHAGEAFGLPSIHEAIAFCGADRLGHGVRITDDIRDSLDGGEGEPSLGRLANYVRDKRIPLELCPSSNVQTGAVKSIEEHPFDLLARQRFRVTVNTDNRLMSDTTMSREMLKLVADLRLRLERPGAVHDQRDEVGIHPVPGTAGDHRRHHQAGVRGADRLSVIRAAIAPRTRARDRATPSPRRRRAGSGPSGCGPARAGRRRTSPAGSTSPAPAPPSRRLRNRLHR